MLPLIHRPTPSPLPQLAGLACGRRCRPHGAAHAGRTDPVQLAPRPGCRSSLGPAPGPAACGPRAGSGARDPRPLVGPSAVAAAHPACLIWSRWNTHSKHRCFGCGRNRKSAERCRITSGNRRKFIMMVYTWYIPYIRRPQVYVWYIPGIYLSYENIVI